MSALVRLARTICAVQRGRERRQVGPAKHARGGPWHSSAKTVRCLRCTRSQSRRRCTGSRSAWSPPRPPTRPRTCRAAGRLCHVHSLMPAHRRISCSHGPCQRVLRTPLTDEQLEVVHVVDRLLERRHRRRRERHRANHTAVHVFCVIERPVWNGTKQESRVRRRLQDTAKVHAIAPEQATCPSPVLSVP